MSERGTRVQKQGRGIGGWLLIVAAVLLALFFVLNLQTVEVSLIVAKVKMPLVFALAIAACSEPSSAGPFRACVPHARSRPGRLRRRR